MKNRVLPRFKILLVSALGVSLLVGCKSEMVVPASNANAVAGSGNTNASSTATPTATPGTTPTATPAAYDAELYFKIISTFDQAPNNPTSLIPALVDGAPVGVGTSTSCNVVSGQLPAPGNAAALTHSCWFSVPEAQLYTSGLTLAMGSTDTVNCHYLKFYPYFYEVDNVTPVVPPGAVSTPTPVPIPWTVDAAPPTPVSCYGFPTNTHLTADVGNPGAETARIFSTLACYNGPAVLLPGFPYVISKTVETQYSQQLTYLIDSANSKNQLSNRWTSNDTANKHLAGSSVSGEYMVDSMHDYNVQCLNQYHVLTYQIKVTISAQADASGNPATFYKSWR